jgi:hypothetical protein
MNVDTSQALIHLVFGLIAMLSGAACYYFSSSGHGGQA